MIVQPTTDPRTLTNTPAPAKSFTLLAVELCPSSGGQCWLASSSTALFSSSRPPFRIARMTSVSHSPFDILNRQPKMKAKLSAAQCRRNPGLVFQQSLIPRSRYGIFPIWSIGRFPLGNFMEAPSSVVLISRNRLSRLAAF